MKLTKKLITLAAVGAMAVSLVACGDSSSSEASSAASEAEAAVEETVEAPEEEAAAPAEEAEEPEAEPAAEEAEAEEPEASDAAEAVDYSAYTLGVVQPGPENYYQTFTDRLLAAAEHVGFNTVSMLSDVDANTELNNIQDLISQEVDAIAIFPVNSASGQADCALANEAGIPIIIVNASVDEGAGVPDATTGNSYYDMGHMNAEWLLANLDQVPGGETPKVLELQGYIGQGVADEITRGFEEGIEGTDVEIVYQADCQWDRQQAISATEDMISGGTDFNVIFVHNEDMCRGVVETLAENNLTDDILVMTQNGSDEGFAMLDEGKIACTVSNSPSLVAADAVIATIKALEGTLTPEESAMLAPVYTIDLSNYQDPETVTWDESWAIARVDDFLAGK